MQIYASRKMFILFCLMISEMINFSFMSVHFFFPVTFIFKLLNLNNFSGSSLSEKHLSELKRKNYMLDNSEVLNYFLILEDKE